MKALDLLRDSRCLVHSIVSDRHGKEGDLKLYGRSVDVNDPERRRRFADVVEKRIGSRPEEPQYQLFSVNIDSAGFVTIEGDKRVHQAWRA